MKKFILFALMACMLLTLAACGDGGEKETTAAPVQENLPGETQAPTQPQEAEEGFVFDYNGTIITMHAPAEPIVAALGEPKNYSESASCAFTGLDKTYFYGSFYMDTYPVEGKDFVYGWWFVDDSVATQEGIYIGCTREQVETTYGADTFNGENAYEIIRNNCTMTIIVEEDVVTSIQYAIILD